MLMSTVAQSLGGVGAVRHSAGVPTVHRDATPALICSHVPQLLLQQPRSCTSVPTKKSRGGNWGLEGGGGGCGRRVKVLLSSSETASSSSSTLVGLKMCPITTIDSGAAAAPAVSRVSAMCVIEDFSVGGEEGNSAVLSLVELNRANGVDSLVDGVAEMGVSDGRSVGDARREGGELTSSDEKDLGQGLDEGFHSDSLNFVHRDNEESVGEGKCNSSATRKREFCKRCCKAASRCICGMITNPVNNRTEIIILQHPLENNHHLGTARIAVVGLRSVKLISVPEDDEQFSTRMRPKVPGSKRQIAGRGGKKSQFLAEADPQKKLPRKLPGEAKRRTEATIQVKLEVVSQSEKATDNNQVVKMATLGTKFLEQDVSSIAVPPWINLQPGAGLLFPSEHATDLQPISSQSSSEDSEPSKGENNMRASDRRSPTQLIVLDGTWSKAKRIFYENPWLYSLPHYRLPPNDGGSRYGLIRKEPKPGCMSTVESIVLALRTLEPETEGLDALLDVFDFMIEDQKKCMGEKYSILEEKCRSGLSQRSKSFK